jgi:hypothetical protein
MRSSLSIGLLVLPAWLCAFAGHARGAPPPADTPAESGAPAVAEPSDQDTEERARLRRVLDDFRAMPGLYAKFREEKHLALLTTPLVNEGTLHFAKGLLARRTTSPVPSIVLVRDGRLEVADRHGRLRIDLASEPVVALFVASFVEILAGDEAALERIYDVRFDGGQDADDAWRLALTPRLSPMTKVVSLVEIEGRGKILLRMRVVEVSGDETRTTFTDVDPARIHDDAAIARIFSTASLGSEPRQ